MVIPRSEVRYSRVTHPSAALLGPEGPFSRDLHVLGTPPAFVLSQDQTLQFDLDLRRLPPLNRRDERQKRPVHFFDLGDGLLAMTGDNRDVTGRSLPDRSSIHIRLAIGLRSPAGNLSSGLICVSQRSTHLTQYCSSSKRLCLMTRLSSNTLKEPCLDSYEIVKDSPPLRRLDVASHEERAFTEGRRNIIASPGAVKGLFPKTVFNLTPGGPDVIAVAISTSGAGSSFVAATH